MSAGGWLGGDIFREGERRGREDAPVPVATGSVVAVAPPPTPPRWVSFFLGMRLAVQCWQIPRMVRVCV